MPELFYFTKNTPLEHKKVFKNQDLYRRIIHPSIKSIIKIRENKVLSRDLNIHGNAIESLKSKKERSIRL
jgi:hypothetical protein